MSGGCCFSVHGHRNNFDNDANINDILPNEILGYIFTFLSVRDRLLFVSTVCKKWRASIIYNDVKSCEIFDLHDDLCALDFECPLRKKKNQSEEPTALDKWLENFSEKLLIKIGPSLKVLSFQMKRHQSVYLRSSIGFRIELMGTVLKHCPKLVELNLMRCLVSGTVGAMLQCLENLKILRLNYEEVLDDVWFILNKKLLTLETRCALKNNFLEPNVDSSLISLTFHDDVISETNTTKPMLALDQIVQHYANISELNIQNCPIGGSLMSCIADLKNLASLAFTILETTSPNVFIEISRGCCKLTELVINDRYSNGKLDFEPLMFGAGPKLKKLAFQSNRIITNDQLNAIKQMKSLQSLTLRTNKFPSIEEQTTKSICQKINELALSSANREEKSHLYKTFLNNLDNSNEKNLNWIGYLPRGWSLHATDGIEPKMLADYLCEKSSEDCKVSAHLVKLLLYASDSGELADLFDHKFDRLTGLIIFGQSTISDECSMKIALNCPRLNYLLTESDISLSPTGIVNLLENKSLDEIHIKFRSLEADERFCYALGNHPNLRHAAFRGMLMPNKLKLTSKHWDQIMQGRVALVQQNRTCQRLFIDCCYENRPWPKRLALAMRTLSLSCRGLREIEDN